MFWQYCQLRYRLVSLTTLPYYILIVLPIIISILIAALNRFRYGAKWVLIRAAAEAIKSEIYQYRTRSFLSEQTDQDKRSHQY